LIPTSRKTAMPRLLYPWLLLLIGCEANWTLVDTEAASQRESVPIVTASEEQPEIPEQDVRADWLKGKVVHIVDGDTLDLLMDEEDSPKKIRIRLQGIDAPESGQPWGTRATQALSELVSGEVVEVLSIGEDRDKRLLGRIYIGEEDQRIDVNLALVAQGLAWHYKYYSDDEDLSEAELAARRERRGLWSDPNPIPPWDWRKQPRETERDEAEFVEPMTGQHWLNTTTGVRHNTNCENWGKTKRGRPCGPDEGRACGICGG
jgi:micrococcal nuclease